MKRKKWKIPKDEVWYSNSDVVTLKGDLEIGGTLIIVYKNNSQEMKDALDVLGTTPVRHHQSEPRSKRKFESFKLIVLDALKTVID